jgi:hypothetical protein
MHTSLCVQTFTSNLLGAHLVALQRVTACGYWYPTSGGRIKKTFPLDCARSGPLGPGELPKIDIDSVFTPTAGDTKVHSAQVRINKTNFLVVGRWSVTGGDDNLNESLLQIKRNTVWFGEIAAFVLGKRVPILSYRVSGKAHNAAVRRKFLSFRTANRCTN